jgi:hypothetical protein
VADSTIREFLVGLGFSVDQAGQRNFVGALEGATLRAKLLGDAIEDMARTVVDKVAQVATQFEQLFYQSQRIGASASSIRAYEYAISQLGGTVEGANSSLEDFGSFLRNTPHAAEAIARALGIPLKDASDHAKFLLEAQQKLGQMPVATANLYRDAYHLGDPATLFAGERAAAPGLYGEQLGRDAASGITGQAMEQATKFEQAWRGVWARIGTMAEGGESKLLTALTNPMQKFSDWLDKNSPQINDAIGKIADSIGAMTNAWVEDLDKVKWDQVATSIQGAALSIEHFTDALTKDLPLLQAFLGALVGAKFGALFGPWGALAGLVGGAAAPSMIEQEMDPNAPHSVDTGVGGAIKGWWKRNAPRALGGGGAGAGVRGRAGESSLGTETAPIGAEGASIRDAQAMVGASEVADSDQLRQYLKTGGADMNPRDLAWCAGFVNATLGHEGIKGTGSRMAGSFARWGQPVNGKDVRAGDVLMANDRSHVGMAEGSARMGPNGLEVKMIAGNERDSRFAPGPGRSQAGKVGERWVPLSEFTARRAREVNGTDSTPSKTGGTSSTPAPATRLGGAYQAPSLAERWDQGQIWSGLNDNLPVGPPGGSTSKTVNSSVHNEVHVHGTDPQSTAAMVGVHLDRTSNDIARNLQGATQ